jgi:bacillithiol biosynthesis deacetylase BshB1
MKRKCFLVVAPHPDDGELGVGGTMLLLRELGHRVVAIDLTSGEPTPHGSEEKRQKETAEASAVLGIEERINLGLPNRYLVDEKDARLLLAESIRTVRPDAVFAPLSEDAHPDHVAAHALFAGARFYAKYTKLSLKGDPWYVKRVFHYSCSHLRVVPQYSFLVDISKQFKRKMEAVHCYRSQFVDNPDNRSVFDLVRIRDSYFGSLIGVAYAEPLYAQEALGVTDPACFLQEQQ